MSPLILLLVVVGCVLAEGFFSGSELAIISADRLLLKEKAAQGNTGAALALKLLRKPHFLISTSLVGTNLMVVIATTLTTMFFINLMGREGELVAVLAMSPLLLIFGELIPKTVYQAKADYLTPVIIYPKAVFYYLFAPLARPLGFLGDLLLWIVSRGKPRDAGRTYLSRQEFKRILLRDEITAGGDLKREEKRMLRRIVEFGQGEASDAYVPLIEVVAVAASARVADILPLLEEENLSRYPVYETRVDNVVGVLHTFDILRHNRLDAPVGDLMRPAFFVPENMPMRKLLAAMQRQRVSLAVVVDEFGGAVGIVTMEDILEEIVGEIDDEYDESADQPSIRQLARNRFCFEGKVEIDAINEIFPGLIPEGDYNTIAGLALEYFQRIPATGEEVRIGPWDTRLQVMEVSDKAILSVQLTIPIRFVHRRMRRQQTREGAAPSPTLTIPPPGEDT